MPFVYFIKSKKADWFYVGSTFDLNKRLIQHNKGEVRSTKFRAPYKIVYEEEYDTIQEARKREKEIKSNRSKKEEILKALSSNG